MATATLCEKTDYRLSALPLSSSSSGSQSANQSLFLVKLTDSSERALEKFLANQKRISRRPMIHFESAAGGSISIPSSEPRRGNNNNNNKDDDEDDDDVFYFSIGQEASGCVDITAEAGRGQLRPVGSAKQKLTIHATSETFSQTREKMAQLEDANKQQQAKEIKPGLKGKRGKQMVASSLSSSSKSASSSGSKTSFVAAAAAKALPSSSSLSSSSRSSPSLPEVGVRVKTKPEPTRTKQPTPPPSSSSFRSQDTAAAASTNLNTSSSSSSNLTSTAPPPSSSSLTPLTGRPLRDRILHLLALKPYKKAELVLRLRVDGFTTRKEEPEALADLLNSIGYTPKSKPSSFMLKKELYKEVDPHWEFYTDDERKQLSKQLAHYSSDASSKRVDGSDGGKASSSADDKTSASAKRPASLSPSNDSATSAPNYSKKAKRIAHRPKGAGGPGDGVAGGSTPPPPSTTPQQSPSENRSVSPVTPPTSNGVTSADNSGGKSYKTSFKTAPLPGALMNAKLLGGSSASSVGRPFAESSNHKAASNVLPAEESSASSSSSSSASSSSTSSWKENDYLVKYEKIVSPEQEKEYTSVFEKEYSEYVNLMESIKTTATHAKRLDLELENTTQGTPEHELAKKKLMDYHADFKKRGGRQDRLRVSYLSRKLSHLKRLIREFNPENA